MLARSLILLAVLLAVPFGTVLVTGAADAKLDHDLREALLKDPALNRDRIAQISVPEFCKLVHGAEDAKELCSLSRNLEMLRTAAFVSGGVSVALLGVIALAGRVARRRRALLYVLFAPGLHITMLTLSGSMIANAILATGAIYLGESVLVGRVHVGIIAAIGIGAVIGVGALLQAQSNAVARASTRVNGRRLDPERFPAIWSFVGELARAMGADGPNQIILGLDPNFFVTEADVVCVGEGLCEGRTMYLSSPLCRILSRDECAAILGHELAHYKGRDSRFSKRFYPVYRGATSGLQSMHQSMSQNEGLARLILMPAFLTLSVFLDAFAAAEREISREREIAADAEAARLVGPAAMGSALVKVHAYSVVWDHVRWEMKEALGQGQQVVNGGVFFGLIAKTAAERGVVDKLDPQRHTTHPTDTHPPLAQRLAALAVQIEDVRASATDVEPVDSAAQFLEGMTPVEEELTELEQLTMLKLGQAQLPADRGGAAA